MAIGATRDPPNVVYKRIVPTGSSPTRYAPVEGRRNGRRDLRLEPLAERRRLLARLVRSSGLVLNEQYEHDGPLFFEYACALGCEGIVSKRKGSRRDWVKTKNPAAPAVKQAEEDWGKDRWR